MMNQNILEQKKPRAEKPRAKKHKKLVKNCCVQKEIDNVSETSCQTDL